MKTLKPLLGLFVAVCFVSSAFAFLGGSAPSPSAHDARVPQTVSYSPQDPTLAPTLAPGNASAGAKGIRLACYPNGGECTRNSDCCTGFCRSGLAAAYCDYR